MREFGLQLKELRQAKKLSQAELGERIDRSRSTIANYESGKTLPDTLEVLDSIAKVLEVSFAELICETELEVYGHMPQHLEFALSMIRDLSEKQLEDVLRYAMTNHMMRDSSRSNHCMNAEGDNYSIRVYHNYSSFDYRVHVLGYLLQGYVEWIEHTVKGLPDSTEELGVGNLDWRDAEQIVAVLHHRGMLKNPFE